MWMTKWANRCTHGQTCSVLLLTAVLDDTCLLLLWDYDKTWSSSLSLCCGCQIDYGIQTWDDCVADASWSPKVLVYCCYLPDFISLWTHTHTHIKQEDCLNKKKNITLIVLIQEDTKLWQCQDLKVGFHHVFISTSFQILQQCWSDWHSMTVGKKMFDTLSICCMRASIRHGDTWEQKQKKTPVLQRDMVRFSILSNFLPLLHTSTPFTNTHTHTHTTTHMCSSAASHWSCKLWLRHVYAPFLPTVSCHWPITAKSITSLLERLILINC